MPLRVIVALLLFALSAPVYAGDFSGPVVRVVDGDDIRVMHEGQERKIRLYGIDAPELNQPYGQDAKKFVQQLVAHQSVTVHEITTDKYGRTVAEVRLADERHLNHQIVNAGLAWWYKQYAPHDKTLETLEGMARAMRRGLWADPNPTPPWEWRR